MPQSVSLVERESRKRRLYRGPFPATVESPQNEQRVHPREQTGEKCPAQSSALTILSIIRIHSLGPSATEKVVVLKMKRIERARFKINRILALNEKATCS